MADPKKVRAEANAMIPDLLERLARDEVRQLETRRAGVRVRVTKLDGAPVAPMSAAPASRPASAHAVADAPAAQATDLSTVNAPLTGIFYRGASPQAQPFVQVGTSIAPGDVIGLIEAMKLFNEIRSTAAGRVTRIFAENGQLVRAHQPLVEVQPA